MSHSHTVALWGDEGTLPDKTNQLNINIGQRNNREKNIYFHIFILILQILQISKSFFFFEETFFLYSLFYFTETLPVALVPQSWWNHFSLWHNCDCNDNIAESFTLNLHSKKKNLVNETEIALITTTTLKSSGSKQRWCNADIKKEKVSWGKFRSATDRCKQFLLRITSAPRWLHCEDVSWRRLCQDAINAN